MKYVKWFDQLSRDDVATAGGKGANLGELTAAGIPVPDGFVVLSSAYFAFLEANRLRPKLVQILATCDPSDPTQLAAAAAKMQKLMRASPIPGEISREIIVSYHRLASGRPVAVRSSATAEDLPEASFAGQQASFLNVVGDANVVLKVRECWASLFEARSIFYRTQKKFAHFQVGIAVPVQRMIQSEASGVMFTTDPVSKDRDRMVIEAAWGLGDYLVQGVVTPDLYQVSRASGEIISKTIAKQEIMEVGSTHGVKQVKVPRQMQEKQKLSDENIIKLVNLGKKIHRHYFFPQDIEWALEKHRLYITQSRPVTTLGEISNKSPAPSLKKPLLKGSPAAPGVAVGPVRQVASAKQLGKVTPGDILVTDMTTPDFVPAMKRAAAIVTNKGGLTSHAAIVSRELGVPCVVGTATATRVLKEGMIVTVNGTSGEVFQGGLKLPKTIVAPLSAAPLPAHLKTATKIYVNLAEPDKASQIAAKNVDGVGLLRAEFMIAGIGVHPKKLIAEGKQSQFVDQLAAGLETVAKAFFPRPVIYRATDFKTNEYRHLKGGERYEMVEPNPMLGFRGALRYVADPAVFELELAALRRVRTKHKLSNLQLMIPFVRTPQELLEVKKIVVAKGSPKFGLWMMVEIPSNVILLEEFLALGLTGVSIGSNDLTMMILGTDRDNSEVASVFDERQPAVLWALEKIITTCLARKVPCSICGEAPSTYPDLVEKLVRWGITSISVNPDAIESTRQIVYSCEQKIHALS